MNIVEQLKQMINSTIDGLWTLAIAKVESVNRTECTCTVILKYLTINGVPYARLTNIPVVMPRGRNSMVLVPIDVGDVVLVAFTKFPSGLVIENEDMIKVENTNTFSIKNAVVLAGFILGTEELQTITGSEKYEIPTDRMVLVSDQKIDIVAPQINIGAPAVGDKVVRQSDTLSVVGNTGDGGAGHTHPVNINVTISTASSKVRCG